MERTSAEEQTRVGLEVQVARRWLIGVGGAINPSNGREWYRNAEAADRIQMRSDAQTSRSVSGIRALLTHPAKLSFSLP